MIGLIYVICLFDRDHKNRDIILIISAHLSKPQFHFMKTKYTQRLVLLASCLTIYISTYAQAADIQDSLALVDLYSKTGGTAWTHRNNWLTINPVSTWYGIKVTGNRVTAINLEYNNLAYGSQIPLSIGNLTALVELNLSANYMGGTIPSVIGNLVNLTSLDLSSSYFYSSIPIEIANLSKLENLDFGNCQNLGGSIPPQLGNLVNLKSLIISSSFSLTGSIPPELGNLSNLTFLMLAANHHLSGNIPPELGKLSKLEDLYLGSNVLTGSIPPELGKLAILTSIDLSGNQLSGAIPEEIGNLTNVKYFTAYNNKLSGEIPAALGNLVNVLELGLSSNNFVGAIPSSFGNLKSAISLDVSGNYLTGIPSELSSLTNLEDLSLYNNRFTFDGLEPLAQEFPYPIFWYSPQARIAIHANNDSLSVYAGGTLSNNTYKWYKVGVTNPKIIVGDSLFQPTEGGKYYAAVTNSICTALTLYSDTVAYGSSDAVNVDDSLSLVALYDSTNGPGWNNHSNWLTGPVPGWYGITIADGRVTGISLSGNNLSGKITYSIGNLERLQSLDLSDNLLNGGIPKTLPRLVNLSTLNLSSNSLAGAITSAIAANTNLHYLYLDHNRFSGSISGAISNLPLVALDISHNRFTFDGMELIAQRFPFAVYDKQKRIAIHQNGNMLSVSAGGTLNYNAYRWYKVGEASTKTVHGDSTFMPTKSGEYYAKIGNRLAKQLILRTDTIVFIMADEMSHKNAVLANGSSVNSQSSRVEIYPNPAKNILSIHLNGSASFSLLNQNGKIMITKAINNSGVIDVSHYAAGLYYLKNNNKAEVQKIMVVK